MILLIILALITAYLLGTGSIPPNPRKWSLGVMLFVFTAVLGFINLKLWGLLFLVGMIFAIIIVWILKMSAMFKKVFRKTNFKIATDKVTKELISKHADDPAKLAEIEMLQDEEDEPGIASIATNKLTNKQFVISTLVRNFELDFDDKNYTSLVESAIYKGKVAEGMMLIKVDFLGGKQKDVGTAHKLVTSVVEKELQKSFTNGDWWTEFLHKKHLLATPITEYQELYEENLTSIVITKE